MSRKQQKLKGGRLLDNWLESYIEYTDNSEPPLAFHLWSGLSTIAGALQRKVYLKWGHSTLFPNHYIILVGPSGQSRKGEALKIAKSFLEELAIPIAANRITREGLIRFMKNSVTNFLDKSSNVMKFQSAVTCISEELAVFLGQKDVGRLAEITDWYDSGDEWTYETKNSGIDRVVGMCFNLLGGTAPDWLPSMLPQEAIGGGFTSRTFFVVEDAKRKIVADPNLTSTDQALRERLIHDLELISTLSGEYHLDEQAKEAYTKWYIKEEESARDGKPTVSDARFDGYSARRATHVKKMAMCLCASRTNDLVIEKRDFNQALKMMTDVEKKMTKVFTGIGKSRFADLTEAILEFVESKGYVSRSEVMRRFFRDVDAYSLEQIERNLDQMKAIRIVRDPEKKDTFYEYQESGLLF